jgi:hypothetical protein
MLFCSSSPGFFTTSIQGKSTKTIIPNTGTLPPTFSTYLIWPETQKQSTQINQGNFISALPQDYCLSPFYMPIVELMTHQQWSYLPSDFTIEDLLYANLKLDRLIKEYNSLKERSFQILQGLDVPYMDRPAGLGPRAEVSDNTLSLEIDSISNHIRLLAGPAISVQNIGGYNAQRFHRQTMQSAERQPLHTIIQPLNASSNPSNNTNSFSYSNRVEAKPESGQDPIPESAQFGDNPNERLPWIERFAVSMISYFKDNKAELIFCLVLLLGLYQMLFRTRKR